MRSTSEPLCQRGQGTAMVGLEVCRHDWGWLVRSAKVGDRQNRLGFAVYLASEVAARNGNADLGQNLGRRLAILENARLACEDTFCHDSIAQAERAWLRADRLRTAAHWNLLSDMKAEHLSCLR